ncbi:unnamed protein product [Polarella glacialis]|nr:unnamed protein product [Polarella glacialis]
MASPSLQAAAQRPVPPPTPPQVSPRLHTSPSAGAGSAGRAPLRGGPADMATVKGLGLSIEDGQALAAMAMSRASYQEDRALVDASRLDELWLEKAANAAREGNWWQAVEGLANAMNKGQSRARPPGSRRGNVGSESTLRPDTGNGFETQQTCDLQDWMGDWLAPSMTGNEPPWRPPPQICRPTPPPTPRARPKPPEGPARLSLLQDSPLSHSKDLSLRTSQGGSSLRAAAVVAETEKHRRLSGSLTSLARRSRGQPLPDTPWKGRRKMLPAAPPLYPPPFPPAVDERPGMRCSTPTSKYRAPSGASISSTATLDRGRPLLSPSPGPRQREKRKLASPAGVEKLPQLHPTELRPQLQPLEQPRTWDPQSQSNAQEQALADERSRLAKDMSHGGKLGQIPGCRDLQAELALAVSDEQGCDVSSAEPGGDAGAGPRPRSAAQRSRGVQPDPPKPPACKDAGHDADLGAGGRPPAYQDAPVAAMKLSAA